MYIFIYFQAKELKQTIENARLNLERALGHRGFVPGEVNTASKVNSSI